MYDSPSTHSSHTSARPERDHPPQRTPGGLAAYAALVALMPVVLAALAYPAVAAAAVTGLAVGTLGTWLLGRATRRRAGDRSAPVDAPTATETT